MYNENIKKMFAREYFGERSGYNQAIKIFKTIENYEAMVGKDAAQMCFNEARNFAKYANITETESSKNIISILKKYTEWCKKTNVISGVSDGFLTVKIDDVDLSENLSKILFKDDIDLVNSMRSLVSFDDGFIEPVVLVLAWSGVSRDELLVLKDSDVDLDSRVIYGNSGEIIVAGLTDCVCDILTRYRDCKRSQRDARNGSHDVEKDMSNDRFLKKMLPHKSKKFGQPYTMNQIDTLISKMGARYEEMGNPRRHTFINAWRSGRFHKLMLVEKSGVDVFDAKNKKVVEGVFRNQKNYYNALRMYKFYKKIFYPTD